MNKQRRRALEDLAGQIDALKNEVSTFKEEEETARDNLPDSLQEGERGQAMETAADTLEEAVDALQEAMDKIEEAIA